MEPSNCTATSVTTGCNLDVGSSNLYTGRIAYSFYDYNVIRWVAIAFVAAYGMSTILHIVQSLYFRIYWLLYTLFLGALCETLGWVGRLWSVQSTAWHPGLGGYWYSSRSAFMCQICCTIIAPAFFAAANYVLLGVLIRETNEEGHRFSSFKPRGYTILFIFGDVMSLIVQAVGGAMAATSDTLSAANTGAYIMGICFQMLIMIAYTLVLIEFCYRYITKRSTRREIDLVPCCASCCGGRRGRPTAASATPGGSDVATDTGKENSCPVPAQGESSERHINTRVLLAACAASTLLIFVRSVYRTIELTNGWLGPIATDQTLFNVLDGLLMALAVWLFNIVHPGFFGLSKRGARA